MARLIGAEYAPHLTTAHCEAPGCGRKPRFRLRFVGDIVPALDLCHTHRVEVERNYGLRETTQVTA